jgi:hypothetical protein
MGELASHRPDVIRLRTRARSLMADRVNLALCAVFLVAAAFYFLTAATSRLMVLRGDSAEPYNQLANAFLHLRLSIGRAPAALLRLADPYDPTQNAAVINRFHVNGYSIHDFALYHGHLFLTWGPTPVVVLLVPMHLLGLEPSASVVIATFSIVGIGFALATLRVLLRQIGNTTLWMCVLAASALALSSVLPYIARRPYVYETAISGGYCFAMAGIWLAISAMANRWASLRRLTLMSLCFGLATGSRPTLALMALILVPVYVSLRATRRRRGLLMALVIPVGICALLLVAYNQARFGSPLEYGEHYQLATDDAHTGHWASIGNVLPGLWFYIVSPPRPLALFPFIGLSPPPITYPLSLPASYVDTAPTGGLLLMAPILCLLTTLPWIWRRRPALLGALAPAVLVLAGAGLLCVLFLSYQVYGTTERYEADFMTPLLLGALAAWLALSEGARGRLRRLVRAGGGLLAAWGCVIGLAISFTGSENLLASGLPGAWATLENIGAPASTAIAAIAGRPVLAEVSAPNLAAISSVSYTSLASSRTAPFGLSAGQQADLTIVSPAVRQAALRASVAPGAALGAKGSLWAVLTNPGHWSHNYLLPSGGGVVYIPVPLSIGVNRLVLSPLASTIKLSNPATPSAQPLLVVRTLALSTTA